MASTSCCQTVGQVNSTSPYSAAYAASVEPPYRAGSYCVASASSSTPNSSDQSEILPARASASGACPTVKIVPSSPLLVASTGTRVHAPEARASAAGAGSHTPSIHGFQLHPSVPGSSPASVCPTVTISPRGASRRQAATSAVQPIASAKASPWSSPPTCRSGGSRSGAFTALQGADWMIAASNGSGRSPARGETSSAQVSRPPADSPNTTSRSGSPPSAKRFPETQRRAVITSCRPWLPDTPSGSAAERSGWARYPRGPSRYCTVTTTAASARSGSSAVAGWLAEPPVWPPPWTKNITGSSCAPTGRYTLSVRQSSLPSPISSSLNGPWENCTHGAPRAVASSGSDHGVTGTVPAKRRAPTGGSANGMPRNVSRPEGDSTPRTQPVLVSSCGPLPSGQARAGSIGGPPVSVSTSPVSVSAVPSVPSLLSVGSAVPPQPSHATSHICPPRSRRSGPSFPARFCGVSTASRDADPKRPC